MRHSLAEHHLAGTLQVLFEEWQQEERCMSMQAHVDNATSTCSETAQWQRDSERQGRQAGGRDGGRAGWLASRSRLEGTHAAVAGALLPLLFASIIFACIWYQTKSKERGLVRAALTDGAPAQTYRP